jgi:hypothetical protein
MMIKKRVWTQSCMRAQRQRLRTICATRLHEPLLQLQLIPQPMYGRDTQNQVSRCTLSAASVSIPVRWYHSRSAERSHATGCWEAESFCRQLKLARVRRDERLLEYTYVRVYFLACDRMPSSLFPALDRRIPTRSPFQRSIEDHIFYPFQHHAQQQDASGTCRPHQRLLHP